MENRRFHENHRTAERKPINKKPCLKDTDALKKIEADMDMEAAGIALTIAEMFRYMVKTSAKLPNMELDAGVLRLKIDDDGLFFEFTRPNCGKRDGFKNHCGGSVDCKGCETDWEDDYDEEGMIYDGD